MCVVKDGKSVRVIVWSYHVYLSVSDSQQEYCRLPALIYVPALRCQMLHDGKYLELFIERTNKAY